MLVLQRSCRLQQSYGSQTCIMQLAIPRCAIEWNAKMIQYIIARHVQFALVPGTGTDRPRAARYPAMRILTVALALSLAACPWRAALANELGEYGAGQGSHVHGSASLQIVLERSVLEIQLSSPAVNLLGFEGPANSAEKRSSVESVRRKLEQPAGLFLVPGSGCQLREEGLSISGLPVVHDDDEHEAAEHHHEEGHHDDDDHHDDEGHHDDDDHEDGHHEKDHHGEGDHEEDHHEKDHHEDDHHQEGHHEDGHHDGEHHDGEHDDEEHSDIVVSYQFNCSQPGAADVMQLPLLSEFPGIEKLDVQWIVSGKQGARTLTQGAQTLRLR